MVRQDEREWMIREARSYAVNEVKIAVEIEINKLQKLQDEKGLLLGMSVSPRKDAEFKGLVMREMKKLLEAIENYG